MRPRRLKADEEKFAVELQRLRQGLEGTSRSLSSAQARRLKLAKELAACDEEIAKLEATKASTTAKIHEVTANTARMREEKLRGWAGAGGATAAVLPSAAQPPPDLLGGLGDSRGGGAGAAVGDLLDVSASALGDLLGGGSPPPMASAIGGMPSLADDLLGGVCGTAMRPTPSAPADVFEGFEGFDAVVGSGSSGSGAPSCGAVNPFDVPPAGMTHPLGGACGSCGASGSCGAMGAMQPGHAPMATIGGGGPAMAGLGALASRGGMAAAPSSAAGGAPPADPFAGLF